MRWATLSVIVAVAMSGCARSPHRRASPVPVGSSAHSIESGGRSRSFVVYRPKQLAPRAPLVVMLHGGFGSAAQAERSYGWDAEADRGHFVVLYPDGLNRARNAGGGCCGTPGATGVDDVAFIEAAVAAVKGELPVDARNVYATGPRWWPRGAAWTTARSRWRRAAASS